MPPTLDLTADLQATIENTMLSDRQRLRRKYAGLARRLGAPGVAERMEALAAEARRSSQRRERRAALAPRPTYPDALPVVAKKDEIARAIAANQVVIVCGETGSGKTTQLPKICLELGRGVGGMIGHTQPRRIAARTLAARIASELETEVGGAVGYKVRFTDRVGEKTYVKLMTDGILLAETQHDRYLEQYDTILVDEAHERSLNIDFLLGYLKRLLPERPDLKIIVTSATIDPERFSKHFDGAPVIEVSGRVYPVEVRYRPLTTDDPEEQDRDILGAIEDAAGELSRIDRGDVLVFLPGEREIRETCEYLRKSEKIRANVLPLYGRLSAGDQARVFEAHSEQRIVVATNVAETSLTVPGIRYVVDTGLARISRYDPRRKVQRLPIEKIARASADQRRGRCGRTSAGVCIRLYSEEDYLGRPEYMVPEIQRTNLAAVILKMAALELGDIDHFPFVEPPDPRAVRDGYQTLLELGALDEQYRLTSIGRKLARLPIDPRIGRMVLAGHDQGCLKEVLVIAAALSVQDPRQRPFEAQARADAAHREFQDEGSDFASYLKLWDAYHREGAARTKNQLRKWCEDHFLSPFRMREWIEVHAQLAEITDEMGYRPVEAAASYAPIHKALLTGLLGNVAMKNDEKTYVGARNIRLTVFPGSGLAKKRPDWIMAAEIVETERLFARTVATIDPEWIEPLADHIVGRAHFEPHWDKQRGQVLAYERVTLHGLPIVKKRRIDFGRIDAETAREIFLQSALVEGELRTSGTFLQHNLELVAEIRALEERTRQRDLLVEDRQIFAFYAHRVPDFVHTAATFERWRKDAEFKDSKMLHLCKEDLLARNPDHDYERLFPAALDFGGTTLALSYRFAPGEPEDGVTVSVPLAVLHRIDPVRCESIVPGLLADKVAAYLESLPRAQRRTLEPIRERAEACAKAIASQRGALAPAITQWLNATLRSTIAPDAFRPEMCPEHLRMRFTVFDESGAQIAEGRDLLAIQERWLTKARDGFARAAQPHERRGIERWDVGTLQEELEIRQGDLSFVVYPALVDESGVVSLRLFDTQEAAARAHPTGVRRLMMIRLSDTIKQLGRSLPGIKTAALRLSAVLSAKDLTDEILCAAVDRACLADRAPIRSEADFARRIADTRGSVGRAAEEVCRLLDPISAEYHAISSALSRAAGPRAPANHAFIREHVSQLVYPGFVAATPPSRLTHLPRYLKAARLRIERTALDPSKERDRAQQLAPYWQSYVERARDNARRGLFDAELERYRWMLEEWRVSLFAQELKTAEPVSAKKLDEQWGRVR